MRAMLRGVYSFGNCAFQSHLHGALRSWLHGLHVIIYCIYLYTMYTQLLSLAESILDLIEEVGRQAFEQGSKVAPGSHDDQYF